MKLQAKVYEILSSGKPVSAGQINRLAHTTEARKIISDLRKRYIIEDEWVTKRNPEGNICNYKMYKLVGEKNG